MGKQAIYAYETKHSQYCKFQDAPICGNKSCNRPPSSSIGLNDEKLPSEAFIHTQTQQMYDETALSQRTCAQKIRIDHHEEDPVKELLIVGAGPHALTLLLRLLEPDPDFLSEKVRHHQAESTKQMRPLREVHRHVKDIVTRGPSATLKCRKKKKKIKRHASTRDVPENINKNKEMTPQVPPPLTLRAVLDSVQVVDAHGDWLACWKKNFEAIGISQLRSLMNAHADPFDHRSLEYYAEALGRGEELVTLKELTQRDDKFRGPYQVPSTRLFHDFHEALVHSYGIRNVVQKGKVLSITPMKDESNDKENVFEVQILKEDEELKKSIVETIRARRCVCALGPAFNRCESFWEKVLRNEQGKEKFEYEISKRILRSEEIIQFLLRNTNNGSKACTDGKKRFLIVGGGITSAQLVLRVLKIPCCEYVVFIQRSQTLLRHFDVENKWMGPQRGKLLTEFFSKDMEDRSKLLQEARRGGSIPPELLKDLKREESKSLNLICKEEVEIDYVDWVEEEFKVSFDDGSTSTVDYIWLSTGCENVIDRFPVLDQLRELLPINIVNGLPTLSQDLSWAPGSASSTEANGEEECEEEWKQMARKRLWCMGAVAGLQLGADALNIVGARHGAVKIATAIRNDMMSIPPLDA